MSRILSALTLTALVFAPWYVGEAVVHTLDVQAGFVAVYAVGVTTIGLSVFAIMGMFMWGIVVGVEAVSFIRGS